MTPVSLKLRHFLVRSAIGLWILQLGWLAWHFAPEVRELPGQLRSAGPGPAHESQGFFDSWLAALAQVIPPSATYILVDCYETGNYAKIRYDLYPRRQIRLDPKATPTLLFEEIKQYGATYIVVGGCQLSPSWQFLLQPQLGLFHPLLATGLGQVYQADPVRLTAGFYD